MLSQDLYTQVVEFINDETAIRSLEEWTISHSEEIARNPDSDDANLLAAVDLALAEHDNDIRDLSGVKQYLKDALSEFDTVFAEYPKEEMRLTVSASNATLERNWNLISNQQINVLSFDRVQL